MWYEKLILSGVMMENSLYSSGSAVHVKDNKLDQEWLKLIVEAKTLGLTIDEIRRFLAEGYF
jgi:cell division protein FtsL